jgi:AcrR family transcriptional regulator
MRKVTTLQGKRSSLRERFRLFGQDAILDAAQDLFLRHGYRKTTMGGIAAGAGVGVATVFRHLRSKEGVLAALSRRDIKAILSKAQAAITPPPLDAAQGVLQLLTTVLEMHQKPSTKIRGQTRLWLLIPTGHIETDEVATSSDRRLQAMILDLLAHYRRKRCLQKSIDLRDATIAIFAVFYHHYLLIALNRAIKIGDAQIDLERRIRLLFELWNAPPASADAARVASARRR